MSGLTNFLTPYSHLIFANRDKVIVVLALLLGWTVIQLLVARWRTERLERDLTAARANQSTSPARARHMPAQLAEEAPAESGVLPPIKGGRSYARNLGTALQKAGIPAAGPQIYSPPVPSGWNPNTGNNQPNAMPAPMQPPTYAPQLAPWGAPAAQPPAPWAYPAGANRAPFGAQANGPAPTPYAPQMPAGAPQNPAHYQPQFPQAGTGQFPQPFAPPAAPAEFGRPNGDGSQAGPGQASVAPAFTPPGPASPALTPAPMNASSAPPPAEVSAEEAEPKEGGRRGKGKRRRFNLSVLDNLEKMVQSKPAEAPAPAPAAVPVPGAPLAPPTLFEQAQPAEEARDAAAPSAEDEGTSQSAAVANVQDSDSQPTAQDSAQTEAEAEPAPVFEERRPNRPDMRSMLFGEEPELAAPVAAAPESPSEEEAAPAPEETEASLPVEETGSWQAEPVQEVAPVEEIAPSHDYESTVDRSESEVAPAAETVAEAPVNEEVEVAAQPDTEVIRQYNEDSTSADAPAAMEPDSAPAKGAAGVLVIIEDDQAAAEYYATLFRGNGYDVNVANDGVSGVDLCVKVQPQVILLDVMMPRQNGILVLQTLRASDETRNTPVVVMSNFSEPTLIKRALQLGALEYVIKTQVEGAALLNAVPRWMNREKAFAA
jgi:CheY-like chemotaxis protein